MREDYFPGDQAQWPIWFSNFAVKFATYAPLLGLQSEVAGLQNDSAMTDFLVVQYKGQFESSRPTVAGWANSMLRGGIAAPAAIAPYPTTPTFAGTMVAPDIIDRTRALVKRIKAAPGYTESMGHDMGLVSTAVEPVLTAPTLEIEALSGRRLQIKWPKHDASGIEIYVDSGAGWGEEGRVLTEADGTITVRGVAGSGPVGAKVKGIYLKKGEEVGDFGPTYDVVLLA